MSLSLLQLAKAKSLTSEGNITLLLANTDHWVRFTLVNLDVKTFFFLYYEGDHLETCPLERLI